MTSIIRRWLRPGLLLLLAVSVHVPACEYGQRPNQNGNGQSSAYRTSFSPRPQPAVTLYV